MGRHGENIRKRSDGRWEARIIIGYDLNGKAKYHSIYGKTYSDAKEKRNTYLRNTDFSKPIINSSQPLQKITVTQLMQEWLETKRDTVKESSFAHYHHLINRHILPELGNYYLSALTTETIDLFLKQKLRDGKLNQQGPLSSKTVADIRSIFIQSIAYARFKKYPCSVDKKLFYPRPKTNKIKVLSAEEQLRLESLLYYKTTPYKLGLLLTLYGGLRIGELCALQWQDIHFDDGTLHITKTIIRIQETSPFATNRTKLIITHPKTDTSHRIIPLPSFILQLLKEHQTSSDCFLLTGTQIPLEPRSCLAKYKRLLLQAGLDSYTFHSLRHTFATRCVENNFDTKSLSELLGHANITTTLQRYVHPSIDLKRSQIEKLADYMNQQR